MSYAVRIHNESEIENKTYPMQSQFKFIGETLQGVKKVSLVSCKIRDLQTNSGFLFVDQYLFQIPRMYVDEQDFINILNSIILIDTTESVTLKDFYTFEYIDKQIKITNQDSLQHTIKATGNMQLFLGLYEDKTILQDTSVYLSQDNALRIQYITLNCNQCNSSFSTQNEFDNATLCVLSKNNLFEFHSKNLDTQYETTLPLTFKLFDQDKRPVNITFCFIELLFYDEKYLGDERSKLKTKQQQYIVLSPTTKNFMFDRQFSKIAVSDLQGASSTLQNNYYEFYEIYCKQVTDQFPINSIIIDSDLNIQTQNNHVFMWQNVQDRVGQLTFEVRKLTQDLKSSTSVDTFPNIIIRLLIK